MDHPQSPPLENPASTLWCSYHIVTNNLLQYLVYTYNGWILFNPAFYPCPPQLVLPNAFGSSEHFKPVTHQAVLKVENWQRKCWDAPIQAPLFALLPFPPLSTDRSILPNWGSPFTPFSSFNLPVPIPCPSPLSPWIQLEGLGEPGAPL